nr:hypothetical protein [uncultured bacterium]
MQPCNYFFRCVRAFITPYPYFNEFIRIRGMIDTSNFLLNNILLIVRREYHRYQLGIEINL